MRKPAMLAALCACATVPTADPRLDRVAKDLKRSPDAAHVYIYRPSSLFGMAVKLGVTFDGARVGILAPGTFTVLTVRPGKHRLVVQRLWEGGSNSTTLVVEPGRNYYVKTNPGWRQPADIELADDERSAQADIRACALIADTAAEGIRSAAEEIARVNIAGVGLDALLAEATRSLEAATGLPGTSPSDDIDGAIAKLRASRPGIGDRQIVRVAAMAMVASLSPRPSGDSPPTAVDESCGLVLRREGHGAVIARVLPDSPAAVARLEAGLELREVNGEPTSDYSPGEIVQLLAGPPAGEVNLTVGRPGDPRNRYLVLRRAAADKGTVDCRALAGRVLYLHPWGLRSATARRLRDHGHSVTARLVILDLRDNADGLVEGARDLADSFLAAGTTLSVRGPEPEGIVEAYQATPGTLALEQARLVVLVNGNTAGAAEAVAAAIQDNRRGTVLGSKTAGRAMVETVYEFADVRFSIPTARFLRASGQPLDGIGVTPDILDAPTPPGAAMSDVACPDVASPASVSEDELVRRAVGLLAASPDAR